MEPVSLIIHDLYPIQEGVVKIKTTVWNHTNFCIRIIIMAPQYILSYYLTLKVTVNGWNNFNFVCGWWFMGQKVIFDLFAYPFCLSSCVLSFMLPFTFSFDVSTYFKKLANEINSIYLIDMFQNYYLNLPFLWFIIFNIFHAQ